MKTPGVSEWYRFQDYFKKKAEAEMTLYMELFFLLAALDFELACEQGQEGSGI